MRDIKFRAWHKQAKEMLFVGDKNGTTHPLDCCAYAVSPNQGKYIELMQYTGLKDKNGKEIFEGDVVKVWNGNKTTIKHDGFQFCVGKSMRKMEYFEASYMTVLWNVYENPELMENKS